MVVNRRTSQFDVYIGRGSRWGNPFSHRTGTSAKHVVASRDEAIAQYRKLLWTQIKSGEVTLKDLAALNGKRLGCYCAPLPCHGDVLVAAAAWAEEQLCFLRAEAEALTDPWDRPYTDDDDDDEYFCGAAYCDDPRCVQEHAETL